MAAGSWIRFGIGFLLAVEAVRSWFSGSPSLLAVLLAVIYFILIVTYAVFKF